jgi:hypothetical protein
MIGLTKFRIRKLKHGAQVDEKYLWDSLRPIIPYPTGRFLCKRLSIPAGGLCSGFAHPQSSSSSSSSSSSIADRRPKRTARMEEKGRQGSKRWEFRWYQRATAEDEDDWGRDAGKATDPQVCGKLQLAKDNYSEIPPHKAARLGSGDVAIPFTPILLNSFYVGPSSAGMVRTQKCLNKGQPFRPIYSDREAQGITTCPFRTNNVRQF